MIKSEMPALLVTSDDTEIAKSIEKGLSHDGRLSTIQAEELRKSHPLPKSGPAMVAQAATKAKGNAVAGRDELVKESAKTLKSPISKALHFIIHGVSDGDYQDTRCEDAVLKNTHGEQFSSDADRQVLEYLTTVEKIDLTGSPIHMGGGPGPQNGFPIARSMGGTTVKPMAPGEDVPFPSKANDDPEAKKKKAEELKRQDDYQNVNKALDALMKSGA